MYCLCYELRFMVLLVCIFQFRSMTHSKTLARTTAWVTTKHIMPSLFSVRIPVPVFSSADKVSSVRRPREVANIISVSSHFYGHAKPRNICFLPSFLSCTEFKLLHCKFTLRWKARKTERKNGTTQSLNPISFSSKPTMASVIWGQDSFSRR